MTANQHSVSIFSINFGDTPVLDMLSPCNVHLKKSYQKEGCLIKPVVQKEVVLLGGEQHLQLLNEL